MDAPQTPPRLLVLGLGNVLRSDDGIGARLARSLAEGEWPEDVRILDAGTPGLALLDLLEGIGHALIIDACDLDAPPGTMRVFTPDEVRSKSEGARLDVHEADVLGTVRLARELGIQLTVTLVGIQPAETGPGMELSPALAEALPGLLEGVREVISTLTVDAPSDR
jgi:hydrogenase maturation protease